MATVNIAGHRTQRYSLNRKYRNYEGPRDAEGYPINDRGDRICGAKSRRHPSGYCHNYQNLKPNGRCRWHGGNAPVGPAAPGYKHGKQSKLLRALPEHLQGLTEALLNDEDLASVAQEIAVCRTRLYKILEGLDRDRETRELWQDAKKMFDEAIARRGTDAGADALRQLGQLLRKGVSEQAKWEEAYRLMERLRKLAETEAKRTATLQLNIPLPQVQVMMDAFFAAVMEEVKDAASRRRIALRYAQVIGLPLPTGGATSPATARVEPVTYDPEWERQCREARSPRILPEDDFRVRRLPSGE